jgi:hypothetical protein
LKTGKFPFASKAAPAALILDRSGFSREDMSLKFTPGR